MKTIQKIAKVFDIESAQVFKQRADSAEAQQFARSQSGKTEPKANSKFFTYFQ